MSYDEATPDADRLRQLLVGRRIVRAERLGGYDPDGVLHLDDGTVLKVRGNDGGCSCNAGCYPLARIASFDSAITNVEIDYRPAEEGGEPCRTCDEKWCYDDGHDNRGYYRVYVIGFDTGRAEIASFEGTDGNGYYGTGWWLQVVPPPEDKEN